MSRPKKEDPEKICEYCKRSFPRTRWGDRLEDRTLFLRRKYCSSACMSMSLFGKIRIERSSESTITRYCRRFIGSSCECCGSTKNLIVHHCDQNRENNELSNLQTLCSTCHLYWHNMRRNLGFAIAGRMPSAFIDINRRD